MPAAHSLTLLSPGTTKITVHINQPPEGGTCEVSPTVGVASEDQFAVVCSDWVDPEDKGISKYNIFCECFVLFTLLLSWNA